MSDTTAQPQEIRWTIQVLTTKRFTKIHFLEAKFSEGNCHNGSYEGSAVQRDALKTKYEGNTDVLD